MLVEFPVASAHPQSARVSLVEAAKRRTTDPHLFLLYVCCVMGAHQPPTGWAPPIRVRVKARLVRWAQTVEIDTNTYIYTYF